MESDPPICKYQHMKHYDSTDQDWIDLLVIKTNKTLFGLNKMQFKFNDMPFNTPFRLFDNEIIIKTKKALFGMNKMHFKLGDMPINTLFDNEIKQTELSVVVQHLSMNRFHWSLIETCIICIDF